MTEVVQKVNDLKPDIVVLTGDYVQYRPEPIEVFAQEYPYIILYPGLHFSII
jgi:predicted MPP superfamily phosphohydrolase